MSEKVSDLSIEKLKIANQIRSKKILDINSGILYSSLREASRILNVSREYIKNRTIIIDGIGQLDLNIKIISKSSQTKRKNGCYLPERNPMYGKKHKKESLEKMRGKRGKNDKTN